VGQTVMKSNAQKVRTLHGGKLLAGFAGAAADAFTLFEKFEEKLERYPGNLQRAAVELAKDWRSDRVLRRLEALLAVTDKEHSFIISGTGDIIEPDDGILAIGSGGSYALAAARALVENTDLSAKEVVKRGLEIAAEICVYTNANITVLSRPDGIATHAAGTGTTGGADAEADRRRARSLHRRSGRCQEGRCHRSPKSLAASARAGSESRRDLAQQHHPRRADRARQDGDRAPARPSRRRPPGEN